MVANVMTIQIEIHLKQPWLSPNQLDRLARDSRAKWAAQAQLKEAWSNEIREQIEHLNLRPLIDVSITAYRISPRDFDDDNLKGGLKPIIDVMKVRSKNNPHGVGLILEDRRTIMKRLDPFDMKPSEEYPKGSLFIVSGIESEKSK